VADLLHDLDDGMRPISVFFPYLPTSYHKKRDVARVKLGQIFAKVIQARRASSIKEEDVLQQFCDANYQNVYNGRQMTEEEITGLLIAVLFAGQHTSSITSSWTGYFMIHSKVGLQHWGSCVPKCASLCCLWLAYTAQWTLNR